MTVGYATADGTATTADGDYLAASGTLTFAPGVTTQPVSVTVNGAPPMDGRGLPRARSLVEDRASVHPQLGSLRRSRRAMPPWPFR